MAMQDESTSPKTMCFECVMSPLTQLKKTRQRRGCFSPDRNGTEDDADMLDGASSESAAESRASKCEPWWLMAPPTVLASGLGSMGSMTGGGDGIGES